MVILLDGHWALQTLDPRAKGFRRVERGKKVYSSNRGDQHTH